MPKDLSPTSTISYAGVFDRSIYEQNIPSDKDGEVLNGELLKQLLENKAKRLNTVLTERCEQRLKDLTTIIDGGPKAWEWARTIGITGAPVIGGAAKAIDDKLLAITREEAKKQYFELLFHKKLLIDGLGKEAISDLEKQYVVKKRFIRSQDLKDQIEKGLLLAREEGVYVEFLRKFIDNALDLPTTHLKINIEIRNNLDDQPFFQGFQPALQAELKMMVYKLAADSQLNDSDPTYKRSIYYLHGNPGTGKSSAIREITNFVALPCYIPVIRTPADLSSTQLEGARRTMMTHSPGFLAEALLTKNSQEKRYTNGVLVIEDFDRILFGPDGRQNPAALTFLLNYLEPEKRDYLNAYFESDIDIQRLSIVITANKRIPKLKPGQKIDEDPYAALRSRVREIYFPDFKPDVIEAMLTPYNDGIAQKYSLGDDEKTTVLQTAIQHATTQGKLEPRSLKWSVETLALRLKSGLSLDNDGDEDVIADQAVNVAAPVPVVPAPASSLFYMFQQANRLIPSSHQLPTFAAGIATGVALTAYAMKRYK